MSNFYVYMIFDPDRKEPIYVGKGHGTRYKSHMKRTDHHPLTHRLRKMRGAGIEPIISFLMENVEEHIALETEIEAITKYGRKDLKLGPLLNLTDGGEGCSNPSQETRQKKRIAMLGKPSARKGVTLTAEERSRCASFKGKKHTPETLLKMTMAKLGKRKSEIAKTNMAIAKTGVKFKRVQCEQCNGSFSVNRIAVHLRKKHV